MKLKKLKRSFLKRKNRLEKWTDRVLFRFKPNLFVNRLKNKLIIINRLLPEIKANCETIRFHENKEIPSLAWGLKCTEKGELNINYGSKVHAFNSGIVEGTWDGEFKEYDFHESPHFFGSGIKIDDDKIIISCPSHFYEGVFLFYNKKTKCSYFSNSLSYVLKDSIDSFNDNFNGIITTICQRNDEITAKGIFDLETMLYDSPLFSLHIIYYHNIIIDNNKCEVRPKKPSNPKYKSFKEYKTYMLKILRLLHLNSNSIGRSHKYKTLATLSSGYDSSAVAALLVEVGSVEAVTIDVNIAGNDDSGMDVARALGIICNPCVHPLAVGNEINNLGTIHYTEEFVDKTTEFLATLGHGDDIVFKAFEEHLAGKAVYTGHLGDTLWSLNSIDAIGMPVGIINSKSLSEYRLNNNFFHIPLLMIGSAYPFGLHKINYHDDMQKYWVDGSYNRPIARRIIEEQGVSRGTFACSKRSTNPYILNVDDHRKRAVYTIIKRYSWID